jgi:peptidyl-prolyl cis-trans isomerase C
MFSLSINVSYVANLRKDKIMGSHPVTLRILVWTAVFCAACSLSCRRKPPEPTEVSKPQPGPGEVGIEAVRPEPNVPVETGPNSVAVTVNGVNITKGEVDKLINLQLAGMAAQTPKRSPEFIEQYKKMLKQQTLEMMIVGQLLEEKVKEAKIVVTEEEVLNRLKEVASLRKPALSLEDFKKKMEEYGQNFDEVKEQVRKGLSYQKLLETQPGGKISVTGVDANNFYAENRKRFETPEQVRASHILIKPDPNAPDPNQAKAKALAKIQGLLEQVKAGADFAQLARTDSACPSAANGGDLDFFPRGQMEPSFEKVAFATDVNQVSGIVETPYGYHIIKVTDRKAASVTSFEQVKDQIINQLKQKKLNEFAQQYVQSLRASAKIVYPLGKEPKSDRPSFPTLQERK